MDLSILYRGPLSSCNYGCEYCPFAKHSETAAEHKEDERALNRFVSWVSNRDADNIRNRPDTGGGGLRDVGVYVMGAARFATGLEPTDIRARIRWEGGVDVYAAVSARFGDADCAAFTSIRMHPRQEMAFHGDAGVLRLPVPFAARVFGEARLEIHRGAETIVERWPAVNHYEVQAAAFNRAVSAGESYPCPLEFSRGTQATIDAALASAA